MFVSECLEIGVCLRNRVHNLAVAGASKPVSEDSSIDMKGNLLQEVIGEDIVFINGIEPKK